MARAFPTMLRGGAGLLRMCARLLGLLLRLGTLLRHLGMGLLRLLLGLRTLLRLLLASLGLAPLRLGACLLRGLGVFLLRLLSRALLALALFGLGLTAFGLLLRCHLRALLLRALLLLCVARLLAGLGALALLLLHLRTLIVRALRGQTLAGVALHLRLLSRGCLMLRRLTCLLLSEHLLSRRLLGITIVAYLLLALLHLGDLHLALLLRTLLLHLLTALLLGNLLLASGIAIAAAEPARALRPVGCGDRLGRRAVEADLLPALEALGLGLALRPLVRPMLPLLPVMLIMIGLPLGLPCAILGPLRPRRRDVRTARRPVRGDDAAMLALAGQAVQINRTGIVTRRIILPGIISIRRQQVAAIVIDGNELVARIAVAVIGTSHEIGRVGTRLVVIIAVSTIDRLGILHVAVVGLPRPRRNVAVIIGIVRRRVADRVEYAIGAIEIGIGLRRLRDAGEFDRSGRGQSLRSGRRGDRGRGPLLQRHRIGQRRERVIGVGRLVAGGRGLVAGGE